MANVDVRAMQVDSKYENSAKHLDRQHHRDPSESVPTIMMALSSPSVGTHQYGASWWALTQ